VYRDYSKPLHEIYPNEEDIQVDLSKKAVENHLRQRLEMENCKFLDREVDLKDIQDLRKEAGLESI
jgi:hypothetical protein